ncbi:putative serine carboxypeptidase-like 23 [Apium graveolens]|uniref:putative serine carboxypeptidase-like 23 n=1 Tax=Apium graveolens TaxID=4045 RepID=UPI003D7A23A7
MEYYPLNFFILLILMLHGLNYGTATVDEAGLLTAFRRTKMQSQGQYTVDEKWFNNMSFELEEETSTRKMEDDLIKQGLPGQPFPVKFKQYAGYISVDKSTGRSLFYYFTEAVNNPSSKPLILWLNGGPGCSSLGVGAMVEIGPFGVKSDGKSLYARQFSWNKVANVLYVESPAGVGFSYSNATSDYKLSGDTRTAQDAYTFLLNWFARFPQYRTKDFYIIGESYAGFYIPELADVILKKNMDKESITNIQLKGIMVGNGIMNDATDNNGTFDYMWSHAMISDETYQGLMKYCTNPNFNRTKCNLIQFAVDTEVGEIDFYNIYGPVCNHSRTNVSKKTKCGQDYDPCELSYVRNYLNLPQVQESLHANGTNIPYAWDACSEMVHRYWKDSPSSMFPIYKNLISSGLRILIYSGDMDAVVPVTSTRYSLNALKLKVNKSWHYWIDDLGEVGGYQIVYEGLTFSTVRGAGHEVPRVQPQRSLSLLKKFLASQF